MRCWSCVTVSSLCAKRMVSCILYFLFIYILVNDYHKDYWRFQTFVNVQGFYFLWWDHCIKQNTHIIYCLTICTISVLYDFNDLLFEFMDITSFFKKVKKIPPPKYTMIYFFLIAKIIQFAKLFHIWNTVYE